MHFNGLPGGVVGHALVDPRIPVIGPLHQKVNVGRFGLLSDDGDAVARAAERYFPAVVQPNDLCGGFWHVRNGAAEVHHRSHVHEDVRAADDLRGRLCKTNMQK